MKQIVLLSSVAVILAFFAMPARGEDGSEAIQGVIDQSSSHGDAPVYPNVDDQNVDDQKREPRDNARGGGLGVKSPRTRFPRRFLFDINDTDEDEKPWITR